MTNNMRIQSVQTSTVSEYLARQITNYTPELIHHLVDGSKFVDNPLNANLQTITKPVETR